MDVLIVYDSFYGNTLRVAEMFANAFGKHFVSTMVEHVDKIGEDEFERANLVIVGSPTRGFRATRALVTFLVMAIKKHPEKAYFVFDTRMDQEDIKSKILKKMMQKFGYGVNHLEKIIRKGKGNILLAGKGFSVSSSEGPLKPGVDSEVEMTVAEILKKMA